MIIAERNRAAYLVVDIESGADLSNPELLGCMLDVDQQVLFPLLPVQAFLERRLGWRAYSGSPSLEELMLDVRRTFD